MMPVHERLTALAADLREDSRKAGCAATEAQPALDEARAEVAELQRRLDEAKAREQEIAAQVAEHEHLGQRSADVAEEVARLAEIERQRAKPAPPHVQHDATGLMREPVPCSEHGQPDADPFNLTQAAPETVAAITGGHPIIAPRGPGDAATLHAIDRGDPLRTLGDRPPHPPGHHAAPRASRVTGALRKVGLVAGPDDQPATGDEQDGDDT